MRFTHTRLIHKLGAVAAATLSITFIAAGPAMAGTTGHTRSISGNEYLYGAVYGRAAIAPTTTLPTQLRGLVRTYSNFTLPNGNAPATIPTPKGTLHAIQVNQGTNSGKIGKHCYAVFNSYFPVKVTGGTGVFWHASGSGRAHLTFTGYLPRYTSGPHKGQCNENGNPTTSKGASTALYVQITPLTIVVRGHH
jgi:hypothetical protein